MSSGPGWLWTGSVWCIIIITSFWQDVRVTSLPVPHRFHPGPERVHSFLSTSHRPPLRHGGRRGGVLWPRVSFFTVIPLFLHPLRAQSGFANVRCNERGSLRTFQWRHSLENIWDVTICFWRSNRFRKWKNKMGSVDLNKLCLDELDVNGYNSYEV